MQSLYFRVFKLLFVSTKIWFKINWMQFLLMTKWFTPKVLSVGKEIDSTRNLFLELTGGRGFFRHLQKSYGNICISKMFTGIWNLRFTLSQRVWSSGYLVCLSVACMVIGNLNFKSDSLFYFLMPFGKIRVLFS